MEVALLSLDELRYECCSSHPIGGTGSYYLVHVVSSCCSRLRGSSEKILAEREVILPRRSNKEETQIRAEAKFKRKEAQA